MPLVWRTHHMSIVHSYGVFDLYRAVCNLYFEPRLGAMELINSARLKKFTLKYNEKASLFNRG